MDGFVDANSSHRCEASAFDSAEETPAYENLLVNILEYFIAGVESPLQKINRTSLPPIYLQHPGRFRR